jgi:hypothetical protein
MKTIDEIWIKRKITLDKLFYETKWLICSKKPLPQKMAIWQSMFDTFVITSFEQDSIIRSLID